MDTPFGWDPKKKEERDRLRDITAARARVGDSYSDWQSRLCKRARTRREIIQALYDLQKLMDERQRQATTDFGEDIATQVFPWKGTAEMIAGKIALLTAVQICAENTAIQHIPATLQMRTDTEFVVPKKTKFRTIKEFNEIDFVKHFADQPGFKGFYAKMVFEKLDIIYYVIAQYETDSCIACELLNDVCLDDFPAYDDLSPIPCPNCGAPTTGDENSFKCDKCEMLWPKGHGHETAWQEQHSKPAEVVPPHNFDLTGMKVGDWFMGCDVCWAQYPVRAVGVKRCSHCASEMSEFTVTKKDVLERRSKPAETGTAQPAQPGSTAGGADPAQPRPPSPDAGGADTAENGGTANPT